MKPRQFSNELKQQIIAECQKIGNTALVARRHEISENTVYGWLSKNKKRGSLIPMPQNKDQRVNELEKRLTTVGTENDRLKRLVAEKELELAILRELRDKVNPR